MSADRQVRHLMDVIASRTSCRAYKPEPIPEADILHILEAARLAPSACNKQPWRFAVVRDPDARRRIVDEGFLPGIAISGLPTWCPSLTPALRQKSSGRRVHPILHPTGNGLGGRCDRAGRSES
jgi:nitroreductase